MVHCSFSSKEEVILFRDNNINKCSTKKERGLFSKKEWFENTINNLLKEFDSGAKCIDVIFEYW